MYVRVSKASYAAAIHSEVSERLNSSSQSLIPALQRLPGCVSFFASADAASNTMVNVSVWDTLEHAEALTSLSEMTALFKEFVQIGVEFERPVINYEVMWQLP
jgi:quinol monooxygenase YgiN